MTYLVTYIDENENQVGPLAIVNKRSDGTVALMRRNVQAYNAGRNSHISTFIPSPCGNVRVQITKREG